MSRPITAGRPLPVLPFHVIPEGRRRRMSATDAAAPYPDPTTAPRFAQGPRMMGSV